MWLYLVLINVVLIIGIQNPCNYTKYFPSIDHCKTSTLLIEIHQILNHFTIC